MKKVMIAMSGGVDSSVAAQILMNKGYQCIGATMKLHPYAKDINDAEAVAKKLGIPHYTFDLSDAFDEYVISPFVDAYKNGRTPNPCIHCNRHLKFRALIEKADELGCDHIATGHYARIEERADADGNVRYVLKKALDIGKDQSYVLSSLSQEQLGRSIFPLGELTKEDARRIAAENGFANADKPDSQDICFIPDGKYAEFIERHEGCTFPEGDFCDEDGNIMGKHKGVIRYTIGQRKGLGIAAGKPVFVKEIDVPNNRIVLSDNEALFTDTLKSSDFNWVSIDKTDEPFPAKARIRYQHKESPALIIPEKDGSVTVRFDDPQRAITPGQTVVVYDGDEVVGGGTID